jgi:hypothetical protein
LLEQVKKYEDLDLLKDVIDHGGFIVRYNEYIGRLAEFVVEQRRKIMFEKHFSAGKYIKKQYSRKRKHKRCVTRRKRNNKRTIKR